MQLNCHSFPYTNLVIFTSFLVSSFMNGTWWSSFTLLSITRFKFPYFTNCVYFVWWICRGVAHDKVHFLVAPQRGSGHIISFVSHLCFFFYWGGMFLIFIKERWKKLKRPAKVIQILLLKKDKLQMEHLLSWILLWIKQASTIPVVV